MCRPAIPFASLPFGTDEKCYVMHGGPKARRPIFGQCHALCVKSKTHFTYTHTHTRAPTDNDTSGASRAPLARVRVQDLKQGFGSVLVVLLLPCCWRCNRCFLLVGPLIHPFTCSRHTSCARRLVGRCVRFPFPVTS